MGKGPGKTTGWVHKRTLEKRGVHMLGGVQYQNIDNIGLHVDISGESKLLEVDKVIICAGQESVRVITSYSIHYTKLYERNTQ